MKLTFICPRWDPGRGRASRRGASWPAPGMSCPNLFHNLQKEGSLHCSLHCCAEGKRSCSCPFVDSSCLEGCRDVNAVLPSCSYVFGRPCMLQALCWEWETGSLGPDRPSASSTSLGSPTPTLAWLRAAIADCRSTFAFYLLHLKRRFAPRSTVQIHSVK